MTTYTSKSNIRNIQLLPIDNLDYQNYLLQFKTEKNPEMVYDKPAQKKI